MPKPTLGNIITSFRALSVLSKAGYKTYDDEKNLTLDELRAMQGMGAVSARKVFLDLEYYKKILYKEVAKEAIEVAEKVGAGKVLEVLEQLKAQ